MTVAARGEVDFAATRYGRSWHETDMPAALRDVRSQGQSGKHMLALSFSGFDPKQSSSGNVNCWYSTYAPGVRIAAMTQRLARFSYEFEPSASC
jgi:hypothetical protein